MTSHEIETKQREVRELGEWCIVYWMPMLNGRFDDRHEKDVLFQKCNNESSQCKYCSGSMAPWLNGLTGCIIISLLVICQD